MTAPKVTKTRDGNREQQLVEHAKKVVMDSLKNSTLNDGVDEYPKFDKTEVALGKVLGKGGFGTVYEVRGFLGGDCTGATERRSGKRKSMFFRKSVKKQEEAKKEEEGNDPSTAVPVQEDITDQMLGDDSNRNNIDGKECRQFIAEHCLRDNGDARYAVKILSPEVIANDGLFCQGMVDMALETRFLSDITHPNIIKLRAIAKCEATNDKYFLVLDRLYDTLEKRILQWRKRKGRSSGISGKLSDRNGTKYARIYEEQVVSAFDLSAAIAYLHKRKILYRDLKPENIGFDIRDDIKLFDFGLAKELHETDKTEESGIYYNLTAETGSLRYMAPEVATGKPYNEKCDVYSFGILFWEILSCQPPFEMYTPKSLREKVYQEPHKRPLVQNQWPSTMKLLMKKAWSAIIEERYSMEQITNLLRNECVRVRKGDDSGLEHVRRRSTFVFRGKGKLST